MVSDSTLLDRKPTCNSARIHSKNNNNVEVLRSHDIHWCYVGSCPSEVTVVQSLRKVFSGTPSETPLKKQIEIASGIALAVLCMHASCFVHKSIRSEMYLIFSSAEVKLGKPYYVGFSKTCHGDATAQE